MSMFDTFFDLSDIVTNDKEKAVLDTIKHRIEYTFIEGGCVRIPGIGIVYVSMRKERGKSDKYYFTGVFKLDVSLKTKLSNLDKNVINKLVKRRRVRFI